MKSITAFILFTTLCASAALAGPKEAYKEMKDGKAIILDVREKSEVDEGIIKGAEWVPLSAMEKSPSQTIKKVSELSEGKTIYVYCRSGRRSQTFIDKMETSDLTGKNLGGFEDLVKAGLPVK